MLKESQDKVLVITRSFDHRIGGMESHTLSLVTFLLDSGYTVHVLTSRLVKRPIFDFSKAAIFRTRSRCGSYHRYPYGFLRETRDYVSCFGHSYKAVINIGIACSLINFERSSTSPKILTIMHGCFSQEGKEFRKRFMANMLDIKSLLGVVYAFLMRVFLEKRVVNISDVVFVVSSYVASEMIVCYSYCKKKIVTMNNAIDIGLYQFKERDSEKKDIRLIYVGRLYKEKGIDTIFPAMKILAESDLEHSYSVDIVGDGCEAKMLVNLAKDLKAEARFFGAVPNVKVKAFLNNADILIVPSRVISDSSSMITIEAMATGLPVVVSDIPALLRIISDEQSGFIFKAGHPQSLSDTILRCLNTIKGSNNISHNARMAVKTNHNMTQNYQVLLDLL
jgi:glycosyltransferase involved in cell wall biosynthesis